MKKTIIFYSFLLIAIISCNKNKETALHHIKLDIDNLTTLKIEDYFSTDTIELETKEESLIGFISRVSFINDSILVADFTNSKLSLFAPDGKFITNIGKKGEGPSEYISIHDYFVKNNIIHIYDFYRNTILKYSTDNQYLGQYSVSTSYNKIIPFPPKGYVTLNTFNNQNNNPKFSWLDNNFNLIASTSENREDGNSIPNMFYFYKNHILYWETMNNIIYSLSENKISPLYEIDFGKYNIPNNLNEINEKIGYYSKNYSQTAGFINNVIETDTILTFTFIHNLYTYWGIYNKKDNRKKIFQLAKNGEFDKLQYVTNYYNNQFIGIYLPDNLRTDNNPSLLILTPQKNYGI